ncbi:TPA: G5 domain-containing protein, partial [Streptococcus suis]
EVEQVAGVNGVIQSITIGEQTTEITTTPKVDRMVRIGTKLETPTVQIPEAQISEKTVPFETIFQEDPTLEVGQEVEQVAGVNGVIQSVTIGDQITEITTSPKVDRIVRIGTKLETPTVQLPEAQISEKTVPFETIFQEDPTLEVGQEVEQVAGVNGVIQSITIGDRTTEITTTPKVDRIVRIGTKLETPTVQLPEAQISERTVPFETIYQEDPTLEAGLEVEQVAGVNGVIQSITIGDQTTEITKTPKVDRIVRIGTKLETPTVQLPEAQISERTIPFETVYQEDPTLEVGQEVEQVAGKNGIVKIIQMGNQTLEVTTTFKVDRVVRVGTKISYDATWQLPEAAIAEEILPFETIYTFDSTLPIGERLILTKGVDGKNILITIEGHTTEVLKTPPIKQIIKLGTRVAEHIDLKEIPSLFPPSAIITTETIPFETILQENPDLPLGQQIEVTAGRDGLTQRVTLGQENVGIPVIPKIDQILMIGTKSSEESITPSIPFTPSDNKKEGSPTPITTEEITLSSPVLTLDLSSSPQITRTNQLKTVNAARGQSRLPQTGDKTDYLLPQISGLALIGFLGLEKNARNSLKIQRRRRKSN